MYLYLQYNKIFVNYKKQHYSMCDDDKTSRQIMRTNEIDAMQRDMFFITCKSDVRLYALFVIRFGEMSHMADV